MKKNKKRCILLKKMHLFLYFAKKIYFLKADFNMFFTFLCKSYYFLMGLPGIATGLLSLLISVTSTSKTRVWLGPIPAAG